MTRISKTADRELWIGLDASDPRGYAIISERERWVPAGGTRGKWDEHRVTVTREELAAIVAAVEGKV